MEKHAPVAMAESQEQHQPSFELALEAAKTKLYDLTFSDEFAVACVERGISAIDDTEKPEYWQAAADTAYKQADEDKEPKTAALYKLLGAAPDMVYTNAALAKGDLSNQNRRDAKLRTGRFNASLRAVSTHWPDAKPSMLERALINSANICIEDQSIKNTAPDYVRRLVRGAKHETAFVQILERTGRKIDATEDPAKDMEGIDATVERKDGRGVIEIDVKASLHDLRAKSNRQGEDLAKPYVITPENKVVMFSHLLDTEIGDSFFITDTMAKQKAIIVEKSLSQIERATAYSVGAQVLKFEQRAS